MRNWFSLQICRILSGLGRLYGGGSALPGLVMEKINPSFTKTKLTNLPYGIVVISGTNGKTTTTKMLTDILSNQGLKVFTNSSGSNFLRGVTSSLISQLNYRGELDADIAVLELDEAHAIHFVKQIPPTYSLLLNIMPDQIDRFQTTGQVKRLLLKIAQATTKQVILNRNDAELASLATDLPTAQWFGFDEASSQHFMSESYLAKSSLPVITKLLPSNQPNKIEFQIGKHQLSANINLRGVYDHLNLMGAVATAQVILKDKLDLNRLLQTIAQLKPAAGRGEVFTINNSKVELILVKNPSGFQMALEAFAKPDRIVAIALNNQPADGQDTTWLASVDFSRLSSRVHTVTGSLAEQINTALADHQKSPKTVNQNTIPAIKQFLLENNQPKQIYANYTAMAPIRKLLAKLND